MIKVDVYSLVAMLFLTGFFVTLGFYAANVVANLLNVLVKKVKNRLKLKELREFFNKK